MISARDLAVHQFVVGIDEQHHHRALPEIAGVLASAAAAVSRGAAGSWEMDKADSLIRARLDRGVESGLGPDPADFDQCHDDTLLRGGA